MNRLIKVFAAAVVVSLFLPIIALADLSSLEKEAGEEARLMRKIYYWFQVIDKDFFRDSLETAQSLQVFINRIEVYKHLKNIKTRPDALEENEWWKEQMKRLVYCDLELGSEIDDPLRDARWEVIPKLGIPENTAVIEQKPWQAAKKEKGEYEGGLVDVYVLTWYGGKIEKAFECGSGGGYPIKEIPWQKIGNEVVDVLKDSENPRIARDLEARNMQDFYEQMVEVATEPPIFNPFPGLTKPTNASLDFFTLPWDEDGNFSIAVSAVVDSNQFSAATRRRDTVEVRLIVYDGLDPIGEDGGKIAGLSKGTGIQTHLIVNDFPKGKYLVVFSVAGGEDNLGVFTDTLFLPSKNTLGGNTGDIIFLDPQGFQSPPLIRAENKLWVSPRRIFYQGEHMFPYAEFRTNRPGEMVAVSWHITPKKDGDDKGEKRVIQHPYEGVIDTAGRVWQEQPFIEEDEARGEEFTLDSIVTSENFSKPELVLPEDIKPGRYLIYVRLRGLNREFLGLAFREIRIEKGKSNPLLRSERN